MNLIERYVSEIGKHLPRKSRADIETEIRSTLEDMLEERSAKAGRPVDDEMVKELLKEYGAPDQVAATYLPEQYLIGPKLFPIFWLVLKIVGIVLTVLAIVGFGVRFGMSDMGMQAFGSQLAKSALEYFGGIVSAFGNIVLIFAILERALPTTLQDVVIVFVTVTGIKKGGLVQETYANKVYGQRVNGVDRSAIQLTTAAGICAVLDLLAAGKLPQRGFVRQEDVPLADFLANRFGKIYAMRQPGTTEGPRT